MKKIMFTLLALAAALPQAIAQEADSTRATVNVGEGRLESLLTDAQKQAVRHLTVTGTLADEDYAYLRSGLLAQLEELDLRDTYVDTIPARAFMFHNEGDYHGIKITLPLSLRHVCEHGLFLSGIYAAFVVTGDFPTFGEEAFNRHDTNTKFALSAENRKLKTDESDAIYSSDGRTMFFYDEIDFAKPDVEIKYGVETIGGYAFSGISLNWDSDILLPETVDSVGDRAFADITARGNTKQKGIDQMLKHFGLAVEESMAFGDGGNDIPMLRHAGIGVAMGNAADAVKMKADYITDTVDADGIAKALQHFALA